MVLRAPEKAADCTLAVVHFPNVSFLLSVATAGQFPPDTGREVAFAGRSNAGKSSAINAILNRNGLARTSKTPGRTKLLNYFEVEHARRVVDLPGYGYAAATPAERAQWMAVIDALPSRESLVGLFLIVDIRRGVRPEDHQLIEWARAAGWQVEVLLAKSDKLTQRERALALKDAARQLPDGVSVQLFSAHDGTGVEAAQKALIGMFSH
jgi:GTP-binding protein